MLFIVHHLGLADHIMLNGMVRHFVQHGEYVRVLILKNQLDTIQFMYRDCDHVSIDIVNSSSPQDVNIQVTKAKSEGYTIMRLATYLFPDDMWKFLTHGSLCGTWAHVPYFQAGVNPVYMRSKFKVIRDTVRENNLMKLLGLENTEYIVVHN